MAQYPLDMGRKKKMSNALAIQVDAEGKIKYDAIARQGQSKDKVILLFVLFPVDNYFVKRFCNLVEIINLCVLSLC